MAVFIANFVYFKYGFTYPNCSDFHFSTLPGFVPCYRPSTPAPSTTSSGEAAPPPAPGSAQAERGGRKADAAGGGVSVEYLGFWVAYFII